MDLGMARFPVLEHHYSPLITKDIQVPRRFIMYAAYLVVRIGLARMPQY